MTTPTPADLPEALRRDLLTADRLKELLLYDQETGVFTWRTGRGVTTKHGDVAGSIASHGYRLITVDGKRYRAHRLAWLYVHGAWPEEEVDHINQKKDDNRIANLRHATHWENSQNRPMQANNKSGYRGVSKRKGRERWVAKIYTRGKCRLLGEFSSPEQANAAYQAAARELHTHRAKEEA